MHDDLEQTGESAAAPGERPTFARMAMLDAAAALALAESTIGSRLHAGDDASALLTAARAKGFKTLADDGVRLVRTGVTSLEEVMRVVDLTDRMA